jgi:hypothetical protein
MGSRNNLRALAACAALGLTAPLVHAQFGRGGGEWMAGGFDAQRSSWMRTDAKISPAALAKAGFDLAWKVKAGAEAKQAFAPPVSLDRYIGYRGFRSLSFVGLPGGRITGVDTDLGRVEWRQQVWAAGAPPTRRR